MKTDRQVLQEMREIVKQRWTTGALYRDDGTVCAVGALGLACGHMHLQPNLFYPQGANRLMACFHQDHREQYYRCCELLADVMPHRVVHAVQLTLRDICESVIMVNNDQYCRSADDLIEYIDAALAKLPPDTDISDLTKLLDTKPVKELEPA